MTMPHPECGANRVDALPLYILLLGGEEMDNLSSNLKSFPAVQRVEHEVHGHHAWGAVRNGLVNTVIVDPSSMWGGWDGVASTVFGMRDQFPEIVFVLFADEDELNDLIHNAEPSVARRLSHYHRLPKNGHVGPTNEELSRVLGWCQDWHASIVEQRPYTKRYEYDVALSFAGEDRDYAHALADILRAHGVRVFYDTYEQASLWGKDLFTHLHEVYSTRSRYCIAFISKHYVEKMWTIVERRSAQERVLTDRSTEYFLPIRIDDTPVPGLPTTVAFVHIREGVQHIAQLFVRKLGGVLGTLS